MSTQKNQAWVHGVVLGASVLAAIAGWTRDKEPKALAQGDVTVWSGHADDVETIRYESKGRKVTIEAKKDTVGRYYVGTLEREPMPATTPDGGEPAAAPRSTVGFASVGPGNKLAEALAPLKALRTIGNIAGDRTAEFGLSEPEGTVTVMISGSERKLQLGSTTPGGGDRYVRLLSSGEVYVLRGEALRNLESADTLLIERELHEWKDTEVNRVRVEAGGKARELTRGGTEGKRFWADPASPDTNDETVGNWMTKLDRLRPTEYATSNPTTKSDVLRVEYFSQKSLGFLELIKMNEGDKPAYYLRTERTRLYGKVIPTLAEQLEQDLGTLVK